VGDLIARHWDRGWAKTRPERQRSEGNEPAA
jgi:hypothetical protein